MTTCNEFDRWLDDAMPAALAPAARAHAASCARCGLALEAALEIDSLLASAETEAPEGFVEGVMRRVSASSLAASGPATFRPSPFSWWIRAAAQPTTALATAIGALVCWRAEELWSAGRSVVALLAQATWRLVAAAPALPRVAFPQEGPWVELGLALALAPLLLLGSLALYHWLERVAVAPLPRA